MKYLIILFIFLTGCEVKFDPVYQKAIDARNAGYMHCFVVKSEPIQGTYCLEYLGKDMREYEARLRMGI